MKRKTILFFASLLFITSCSILGVHFKIHNPSRAGKYPKKTEARTLLGNQDSKFRTCYDVKWYHLYCEFGDNLFKDHSLGGTVYISATAVNDFDTLQLDLAKNMLLDVRMVGHPEQGEGSLDAPDILKTIRKDGAVFVIMKSKIKAEQNFTLEIQYSGIPSEANRPPWSGGMVWKKDNLDKPWDAIACETEGASLWWPCKDVMNDEPDSVDVSLILPKGLVGVSNGKLKNTSTINVTINKEKVCYDWHVSYPINIYNITFYIGNYKLVHDTYYSEVTHDTLQLNHYVLEQNYDKAVSHFQQLKKYLAFYEKTFGPYPWYRDGFKLVESPYAGMEHQSAIAYGNGYKNDPRNGFDYIILHETAHEWWGNSVTANDLADGWLHEGFATYTEALYVESTKGKEAYVNYLLNYRLFIINRRPIVGEKGIRYFNYKDGDIYMKGAWVLHSLRYAIGNDSLFFDILHSFYMENRMKEISSDKLEELVNRKTGKDFHWFFETYLYDRFTPELEYCVKNGKLYYKWNKINRDFPMQAILHETVVGDPAKRNFYYSIFPELKITTKEIGSDKNLFSFNDDQFLYKPVENKNLWKEFEKQK